MNFHPDTTPPKPTYHWSSTNIPLENVTGKEPINLCDIFCYNEFILKEELILPPTLYPPTWSFRHELEQKIINSAWDNDGTALVRTQTDYSGTKRHCYLTCKYGVKHRSKCMLIAPEDGQGTTRDGVKISRIVNKDKSSRGPQARKESKRAQAVLPMKKEDMCNFKIRLTCVEGLHWCISKKKKADAAHCNHGRGNAKTDRTSMTILTQEERDLAAYTDRVSPSGATQKIIAKVTGRATFSRQQIAHNRNRVEGVNNDTTDAQSLIDFLKCKVKTKEMRYVALYHQVTETTLLAIDKYQARKKQKELLRQMERNPLYEDNDLEEDEEFIDKELEEADNIHLNFEIGNQPDGQIELKTAKEKITIAKALEHIKEQLVIGKRIMLGCAWCREDERQFFRKFPEVHKLFQLSSLLPHQSPQ